MAYCKNCGNSIDGVPGGGNCPYCGTVVAPMAPNASPGQGVPPPQHTQYANQGGGPAPQGFMNTPDYSGQYSQQDIEQNKGMAVLSYLGLLVLIPLLAVKDSKFARFHANQGLVLLLFEVGFVIIVSILQWILIAISWRLYFLVTILWLLFIPLGVLAIIGIINAVNGKAKELPVIGKIKLIK